MSESADYKTLKKNMPLAYDRLDRVENKVVFGMPDINFCAEGVECWIEMKSPTEPKRPTTPLFGSNHKLEQDQMNWFLKQRNAKGNAFVLIATNKRWMLIEGKHADFVNLMSVKQLLEIAIWSTDKPVKDKKQWQILRQSLINTKKIA